MLVEIGLMQRFSVLLGHPIWSLALVLASMILSTGIGSLVSDRFADLSRRRTIALPIVIALVIAAAATLLQPAIDALMPAAFAARGAVTLAFTVPIGLALGPCFPVGMRLVASRSDSAMPWMWGINGGFGVLGGVAAVVLSITLGISSTILVGGLCYLSLVLPIMLLRRGITAPTDSGSPPPSPRQGSQAPRPRTD